MMRYTLVIRGANSDARSAIRAPDSHYRVRERLPGKDKNLKKGFVKSAGGACLAAIVLMALSACGFLYVQGNGDITVETRTLAGTFTKVSAGSTVEVIIEPGEDFQATVEIDSNLQEYVELEIRGETLFVRNPNLFTNIWPTSAVVRIVMPAIEMASVTGTGDIILGNFAVAGEFTAILSGTGDMSFPGTALSIDATLSGTGDLSLSGEADSLEAIVSGVGNLDSRDCAVKSADITLSGTGNAVCTVTETVTALLSGIGDLDVYGGARVSARETGLGRVREFD
jgi:hypothetical protein